MAGIIVKQYTTRDGEVDLNRMLKVLKYKMKVTKSLKEYVDSLHYEKPSDKKRKKHKKIIMSM